MNDDVARWQRVKALLMRALDVEPAARAAFLDAECGGDQTVRRDVDSLLDNLGSAGDFIEQPAIEGWEGPPTAGAGSDVEGARFALHPGASVGPYRIESCIGRGGMGEVYRARDDRLDRDVAIKVLRASSGHRDQLDRFLREARVLAALNHPNIGAVYGLELTTEGQPALVLELVEGVTLAARLDEGPMPVPEALRITGHIAAALEAAHAKGIVHRDVKPANITLQTDGTVKVLDFGLAKIASAPQGRAADPLKTATGIVVGTAAYMAPEQACGAEVDARADVWAAGCILFEMLTGTKAFGGRDLRATLMMVLTADIDWSRLPPTVPPPVAEALKQALQRDPDARLASAGQLCALLNAATAPHQAPVSLAASDRQRRATVVILRRLRAIPRGWPVAIAVVVAGLVTSTVWRGVLRSRTAPVPTFRQLSFEGDVTEAVLSPDGRMLAYLKGGQLLVQDVAGGAPISVAQSHLIRGVRWSPTGDRLAFVDGVPFDERAGVHVVPRLGGLVRRVAIGDVVAWSPDGQRLVTTTMGSDSLAIVDATDGSSVDTVTLDNVRWVLDVDWHSRPDRLAVLTADSDRARTIWLVSIDESSPRRVHTDERSLFNVRFAPSGETVYCFRANGHSTDLLAFDTRGGTSNEPRILLTGLSVGSGATVTADGRTLAFLRATVRRNIARWDLANVPKGPQLLTQGTRQFLGPRVSPDGRWITALIADLDRMSVVKLPWSGGQAVPLTSEGSSYGLPAWSPDGARIAVASNRGGSLGVWLLTADGAGLQRVREAVPSSNLLTAWTPDGRLMWQDEYGSVQMNYVARDLRSGAETRLVSRLTPGYLFDPRFSPDGHELAIYWNDMGRPGLYVMTWPGASPRFIHAGLLKPIGWTRDGVSVIVRSLDGVASVSTRTGQLTTLLQGVEASDLSPDGRYVVGPVGESSGDAWAVKDFDADAAPR